MTDKPKLRVVVGGSAPKPEPAAQTEAEKYKDALYTQRLEGICQTIVEEMIAKRTPAERAMDRRKCRLIRKAKAYMADLCKAEGIEPFNCYI